MARLPSTRLAQALARLAALVAVGCSSFGPTRATEVRTETGFAISEPVNVSAEVRADFENAVQRLESKDYPGGIALLVQVTQAAPDLTAAHIDLGIAYGETGELDRAVASLERALELNPRHPVAYNELGIVYRKKGRFDKARKCYEKALELHPDFHFARRNLAILCDLYLNDPACALTQYELYAKAVPDDEATAAWIADLRKRVGK